MNREILFRGQTRRYGEKVNMRGEELPGNWVYGGIFPQNKGGDFSIIYTYDPIEKRIVYADTVGQYTGLTDKNGKKIFEGDIIQYYTDYDGLDGFTREIDVRAVVVWDKDCCSFGCNIVGGDPNEFYAWIEMREEPPITVIGNIHDNPELLEVTE